MNEFGDLTNDQFRQLFMGLRFNAEAMRRNDAPRPGSGAIRALPLAVNWTAKGVVTPIKNQGQCGSCWAFSTTGSCEGAWAITRGKLYSLSEQQLVDCSDSYGNEGCGGGLMDWAFKYIMANGIEQETSYPYKAVDQKCAYNKSAVVASVIGYRNVPTKNETALQYYVATAGPVSVAIDASHNSFQFYRSGVYYEPQCSQTQLDHGVLAVGYGVDNSSKSSYWIVKNSWGTSWGMSGYIWMSRNRQNNCGIATMSSYPVVANASTSTAAALTSSTQTLGDSGSELRPNTYYNHGGFGARHDLGESVGDRRRRHAK